MLRLRFLLPLLSVLLVGWLAACRSVGTEPTAPDTLTFSGPISTTLKVGETLPGTDIQYLGLNEEQGAEVIIGGMHAFKRTADSMFWKGSPVPGIVIDLKQRILKYDAQSLSMAGTVAITVEHVQPQTVAAIADTRVRFRIPVAYALSVGDTVPGTLLKLEEIDAGSAAVISGVPQKEDPYHLADSVHWMGSLRDKVFADYNLRIAFIGEDSVRLAGFVDILLVP
ncbi:MAG: hypothetical protein D6775_13910 [Caldilineae bacterium]|nr:MAG: hypothetical protein D6775_13910 [Caldilineae bacterium]